MAATTVRTIGWRCSSSTNNSIDDKSRLGDDSRKPRDKINHFGAMQRVPACPLPFCSKTHGRRHQNDQRCGANDCLTCFCKCRFSPWQLRSIFQLKMPVTLMCGEWRLQDTASLSASAFNTTTLQLSLVLNAALLCRCGNSFLSTFLQCSRSCKESKPKTLALGIALSTVPQDDSSKRSHLPSQCQNVLQMGLAPCRSDCRS